MTRYQLWGIVGSVWSPMQSHRSLVMEALLQHANAVFWMWSIKKSCSVKSFQVSIACFVPCQNTSIGLFFFIVSVLHISFTLWAKVKVVRQLAKKCFALLSCILTNPKGIVPVPVCAVLASALDPGLIVISDPCAHHMHQKLFLNHRIKLLSRTCEAISAAEQFCLVNP